MIIYKFLQLLDTFWARLRMKMFRSDFIFFSRDVYERIANQFPVRVTRFVSKIGKISEILGTNKKRKHGRCLENLQLTIWSPNAQTSWPFDSQFVDIKRSDDGDGDRGDGDGGDEGHKNNTPKRRNKLNIENVRIQDI